MTKIEHEPPWVRAMYPNHETTWEAACTHVKLIQLFIKHSLCDVCDRCDMVAGTGFRNCWVSGLEPDSNKNLLSSCAWYMFNMTLRLTHHPAGVVWKFAEGTSCSGDVLAI
ncbi:hypothetical protein AVEN_174726-1 [Araneus ventricosus]|uniref:Uncharacterized protein n=1 Tax=Araneus ventricosus TaxID=182803 RepID=A0A4Y2BM11_ARAVE|nr:hypothetical protein AVEN_174726-1 [Araneus ventricosus]